jgi:predicted nucleic-acid-binding protein
VIGLDTNVLVRYIVHDDDAQWSLASRLIDSLSEAQPGFISQIALVELVWVLTTIYSLGRQEIAETVSDLLQSRDLVIDRSDSVIRALRIYRVGSADFADCLIDALGRIAGCTQTVTFDQKAAKSAGMTLITPEYRPTLTP